MKTLLQIAGVSRSGTSLLGYMLGSHSEAAYLGEIPAPLQKGRAVVCADCEQGSCPIWGRALTPEFVQSAYECQREWAMNRYTASQKVQPGGFFSKLFEQYRHIGVAIDSSKKTDWYQWNFHSDNYETRVIHIVRDLRGVVTSHGHTASTGLDQICQKVERGFKKLRKWLDGIPTSRVCSVRYEALVLYPEETLTALCRFLGLKFEPSMLDFYDHPQHAFGGNRGPLLHSRLTRGLSIEHLVNEKLTSNLEHYLTTPPGLSLDTRWISELRGESLELFQSRLGSLNSALGYHWDGLDGSTYQTDVSSWDSAG
jgi:hypothetical protein